jgi:hypothetical protein
MHPQVELLLNYTATATPFVSSTGQAFLSLPLDAFSQQVCSVYSPRIRDWLIAAFYRDHHQPPSPYALRQTIRTLAARANCSGTSLSVQRRVAARGNPRQPDAILLDLANPHGEIVEITPHGWQITTDPAAPFLHSRGNIELPPPRQPPATSPQLLLSTLQRLLNFSAADSHRALVWLLAALQPQGPHPILVLDGPPSSGKSTAARMLRAIIDPSAAPLFSLRFSEPELLALAILNWILAFDHTGQVRPNISATLCRLATGATVREREKGDDREPAVQELHRPILITAASGWNPDESLAERTLTIRLAPLSPSTRRTEAELFQEFETIRPTLPSRPMRCHHQSAKREARAVPRPKPSFTNRFPGPPPPRCRPLGRHRRPGKRTRHPSRYEPNTHHADRRIHRRTFENFSSMGRDRHRPPPRNRRHHRHRGSSFPPPPRPQEPPCVTKHYLELRAQTWRFTRDKTRYHRTPRRIPRTMKSQRQLPTSAGPSRVHVIYWNT